MRGYDNMKNVKLFSIFWGVLIFSLALVGCSRVNNSTAQSKTEAKAMNQGEKAPSFELRDIKGNTQKLSDFTGKKVYIKFWASWCSICLAGLDEVDTLAGEDNDFVVLTVVSPSFRGEKNTEEFIKWFDSLGKKNINVLVDKDGALTNKLGVRGYPTSVFIGSDGVLVKTQPGHKSNEEIKSTFAAIR